MAQNKIVVTTTPPLPGTTLVDEVNDALQSLATGLAGNVDPASVDGVEPYVVWVDTLNGLVKRRNAANTAWVVEGELFQQTARRNGDPTQDFSANNISISSVNGGQLAGLQNKIINGAFQVNQRGVSGTVTLVAGAYGHDRWKAGSGGCTYTFSTVDNVTTITISAGTLVQIIEGLNLQSGLHTLSWQGTAQGRVGSGAYGDSDGVTAAVVGGANTQIEFGTGTVTFVQFEAGDTATPFEHRPIDLEEIRCQRYFHKTTATIGCEGVALPGVVTSYPVMYNFPVPMRANPTRVQGSAGYVDSGNMDSTAFDDASRFGISFRFLTYALVASPSRAAGYWTPGWEFHAEL